MPEQTRCDGCGRPSEQLVAGTSGERLCAHCTASPLAPSDVKESPRIHKPRTSHFLTYSLPSVTVDGGEVCIRFDYPGGYDLHRLSVKEARQIAGELELAVQVIEAKP